MSQRVTASGLTQHCQRLCLPLVGIRGVTTEPLQLDHPVVIGLALAMYLVEFVADKIPWFDSVWDALHTFIRIPAGAFLA